LNASPGTSGEVRAGQIDRLDRKRYRRGNIEDELYFAPVSRLIDEARASRACDSKTDEPRRLELFQFCATTSAQDHLGLAWRRHHRSDRQRILSLDRPARAKARRACATSQKLAK
jgi:hypothetical protein